MNGLPDLGSGPIDIVLRTAIIYVLVVLGLRFAGKGEVGQLSTFDLVALLLLSNAVQNAMVGSDNSLLGGLIAAAVILLLARLLTRVVFHRPRVERFLIGEPRVLIWNGRIVDKALAEEQITTNELEAALRDHGLIRASDVKLAVLETSGSISVIPEHDAADDYESGSDEQRRAGRIRSRRARIHDTKEAP